MNALPPTALDNKINNGVYDSCINTILPSRIPVILFCFVLLQMIKSRNKISQKHGRWSAEYFLLFYYSALVGVRSIVINPSVCLSVCASVCPRAYLWNWNRWTDRHGFFVRMSCGCGSVLLWRGWATLCTSGFMDDVTFGRNGRDAER